MALEIGLMIDAPRVLVRTALGIIELSDEGTAQSEELAWLHRAARGRIAGLPANARDVEFVAFLIDKFAADPAKTVGSVSIDKRRFDPEIVKNALCETLKLRDPVELWDFAQLSPLAAIAAHLARITIIVGGHLYEPRCAWKHPTCEYVPTTASRPARG